MRIVPLSNETLAESITLLKSIFKDRPDQEQISRNLKECILNLKTNKEYWVTKNANNNVIGIIGLYSKPRKRDDEFVLWIGWFGVHPGYRRKGIGSKLLDYVINESIQRGYKKLRVYSGYEEDASHLFYKRHGFLMTGANVKKDITYFEKLLEKG